MSNRRVVLRESVSVPTAGIGQIGGAYLRERRISKLDILLYYSSLVLFVSVTRIPSSIRKCNVLPQAKKDSKYDVDVIIVGWTLRMGLMVFSLSSSSTWSFSAA